MGLARRIVGFNKKTNEWYSRFSGHAHYRETYQGIVDEAVTPAEVIIHLGCGALWFGQVATVSLEGKTIYAVDPDEEALARNPAPHRLCAVGESIPLPDSCADVIVADHLFEHLEKPEALLHEAHRLLRPGGRLVFTSLNLLSYSGLATHLTPRWLHTFTMGLLRALAGSSDARPCPIYFRMNTLWTVERIAKETGFRVDRIHTGMDHPCATVLFPGVHQAFMALHLALEKVEALAPFRITLTGSLVRE